MVRFGGDDHGRVLVTVARTTPSLWDAERYNNDDRADFLLAE
jgi:hypothetical protein